MNIKSQFLHPSGYKKKVWSRTSIPRRLFFLSLFVPCQPLHSFIHWFLFIDPHIWASRATTSLLRVLFSSPNFPRSNTYFVGVHFQNRHVPLFLFSFTVFFFPFVVGNPVQFIHSPRCKQKKYDDIINNNHRRRMTDRRLHTRSSQSSHSSR